MSGCTVYTVDGKSLRSFPGVECLFLDNGQAVSASPESLRLIAPGGKVVWEIPGHFHHQLNLSQDGKRILALGSVIFKKDKLTVRRDKILIVSLEGKVLREKDLGDLVDTGSFDVPTTIWLEKQTGATREVSHLNSIMEIGKLKTGLSLPELKEGQIAINGLSHGTMILSPDLERVVRRLDFPDSQGNMVHDVQVRSDGSLLYFNNLRRGDASVPASAIQILDPKSLRVKFSFEGNPRGIFYSAGSGSVQEIRDDLYLFSGMRTGAYFLNPKSGEILRSVPEIGTLGPASTSLIFSVRLRSLSAFLAKWTAD